MSTRHPSFHQSTIGIRSPDSNQSNTHRHIYRSADRFHGRSVPSTNPLDLPNVDSTARYSISYVPGMSEHVVKTGKTLQEAQLKVVIFACEVERLNTLNYNLVKENEILKAQGVKPEREKDLETKLAIVLAENEKLIQVVDELHDVFQRQRGSQASGQKDFNLNDDYERRIADLMDALDDWKQRYQDLEQAQTMAGAGSTLQLQGNVRELERERELLADRLARQERDLDAVRARLASFETRGPGMEVHHGDYQQKINELVMENERVNRELEIMKLKYGDANTLQLKLKEYDDKIKTLLNENDKLNRILNEKMRELQALRNTVPVPGSPHAFRDITSAQNTERGRELLAPEDRAKRSGNQGVENQDRILRENNDLRAENERLNNAIRQIQRSPQSEQIVRGPEGEVRIPAVPTQNFSGFESITLRPEGNPEVLRDRLELLLKENERLNQLLGDKVKEIEELKVHLKDVPGGNVRVEQLNQQIANLIGENRRLSEVLGERSREIENLKRALGGAGANLGNMEGLQEKIILVSGENERLHRVLEDRNREIEQLRRTIEEMRAGNGRTEQLSRQLNDLLNENARLNDLLMEKTRENENLRRNLEQISHAGQNPQVQNQLLIITAERDRLVRLLDEKSRETNSLRASGIIGTVAPGPQLSEQVNGLLNENKRLNDLVVERVREIEGLRRRLSELEAGQGLRASHYGGHPQDQNTLVVIERERLNRMLEERTSEVEGLKRQIGELRASALRQSGVGNTNQLTIQVTGLLDENKRLSDLVVDRTREVELLRSKLTGSGTSSPPVISTSGDQQVLIIAAERDRLSRTLNERAIEIDGLRRQIDELRARPGSTHTQTHTHTQVQGANVAGLIEENKRLSDLANDRAREVELLRSKLVGAPSVVSTSGEQNQLLIVVAERDRLNRALTERTIEIDGLRRQVDELRAHQGHGHGQAGLLEENKRLSDLANDRAREVELLRSKLVGAPSVVNTSGDQQVLILTAERDRLNRALNERTVEIDGLRRQIDELRAHQGHGHGQAGLIEENKRLSDLANDRAREVELLRSKLVGAPSVVSTSGDQQVLILTAERDRLNRTLNERAIEIDGLRRQVDELRAHPGSIHIQSQTTGNVTGLMEENRRLNDLANERAREVENLKRGGQGQGQAVQTGQPQLQEQIARLTQERDGYVRALSERSLEVDNLRRQLDELRHGQGRVGDLNIQIASLGEENKRFKELLNERLKEIDLLKTKLFELEGTSGLKDHINILTAERDRLNQSLIEKYNEIDGLKRQVEEARSGRGGEIEGLRRRISELEIEISSTGSLREQISRLNAEKEGFTKLLTERLHEIDLLRSELNGLRASGGRAESLALQVNTLSEENRRLERVIEEKTRKIGELELSALTVNQLREQVNQLIQERDTLNRMLSENHKEIDNYKRQLEESRTLSIRIEQLTQQVNSYAEENRRLNDQIGAKYLENDEAKRKIGSLEITIAGLRDELSKKTVNLQHEIEALKLLLDDRTREGESMRSQLLELRSSAAENESLRAQVRTYGEESNRLNATIQDLSRRVADYEVSLREQQDLKTRIVLLGSEIERLGVVLGEKNKEIEELKVSYNRLNQLSDQMLILQSENKRNSELLSERTRENEDLRRRLVELEASETALGDLKIRLSLLNSENDRLNGLISEKVKESDDLRRRLMELQSASVQLEHILGENKRYQDLLTARDTDIEQLRRRISELERNPSEAHGVKAQLSVLNEEHQRVRSSLDIKNKEAEDWRAKYFEVQKDLLQVSDLKVRIQALQGENDRLNGVVTERFREIEDLKRRLADVHVNVGTEELRAKLALVNQENDRLNSVIHEKIRELETLRLTYHSGGSESPNAQVRDLQERIRVLNNENEDLRKRSGVFSPQKSAYNEPSEDLRVKLSLLAAENERLNHLLSHSQSQDYMRSPPKSSGIGANVEELYSRIALLEGRLHDKEREIEGMRRATSITVSPMKGADVEATTFRASEAMEATERLKKTGQGVGSLQSSPEKYGEVERLNRMLIEKENEIDRLRRSSTMGSDQRVRDLEVRLEAAQREVEKLNHILNEKTREETIRFQSSGSYNPENERLARLLADKQREVDDLTLKIGRLAGSPGGSEIKIKVEDHRRAMDENMNEYTKRYAIERQALEGEILGLRQKVLDLEDKVRILSDDNQQLSIINEERLVDIETWKQRFEYLERQKITEMESMRREYDERLKEEVERSMRLMKEGPEATITELRREKISMEERAFNLNREIEKLRSYLDSSVDEVEEWRGRYTELENLRAQEISELRKQFENFRKANVDLKEIQVKFAAERTAYETQILQLQQKVVDLENQVEMLLNENERITTSSLERLKEVELWRKKHGQSDEDYTLQVTELRNQLEMFKSNNYDVKQLAIKYSAERSADQSQIKQLKQMNENYKSELEKLYDLMGQRKNDFDNLAQQNEDLRRMYEKVTKQARDHGTESQDTRERLEFQERQINELEQSREQYRKQAERNSLELTRKNKDLVDKIQELDILKMKYEEALANYQALNSRLFEKLTSDN